MSIRNRTLMIVLLLSGIATAFSSVAGKSGRVAACTKT